MNLFFRESGKGTPLIILHGLYGSSDNWMSIARELSKNYRVIVPDLRNHGASKHSKEHSYQSMVNDIANLFEQANIEKAHIIGHSMGGKLAMAFAADYPEKIRSLIVADIAPINYLNKTEAQQRNFFHKYVLEALNSIKLSKYESRKAIENDLSNYIRDKSTRLFVLKNLHRTKQGFTWKINIETLSKYLPQIIGDVNEDSLADRTPIIQYPVLFIKGSLSEYIDNDGIKITKKIYPESEIQTIEGASHWLHAEKPDEFLLLTKRFIDLK